jgi:CXXC-20-CXXC protein
MDTCKKCVRKFNYWQVYKNFWSAKQQIDCSNCATTHDHKLVNKLLPPLIFFIPAVVQSYRQYYNTPDEMGSFLTFTMLYIPVVIVGSLLTNFFFKFKLIDSKKAHTK